MTGGIAALSHKALANIPEIQTRNEPTTAQPVVDKSCEIKLLTRNHLKRLDPGATMP